MGSDGASGSEAGAVDAVDAVDAESVRGISAVLSRLSDGLDEAKGEAADFARPPGPFSGRDDAERSPPGFAGSFLPAPVFDTVDDTAARAASAVSGRQAVRELNPSSLASA